MLELCTLGGNLPSGRQVEPTRPRTQDFESIYKFYLLSEIKLIGNKKLQRTVGA
jgi:hypothetical protein